MQAEQLVGGKTRELGTQKKNDPRMMRVLFLLFM
jgi:hypothetical protein